MANITYAGIIVAINNMIEEDIEFIHYVLENPQLSVDNKELYGSLLDVKKQIISIIQTSNLEFEEIASTPARIVVLN